MGPPASNLAANSARALTPSHGQSRSAAPAAASGADRRQPARCARGALSRLCAFDHHGPGAAGRARRPEARAPPHPLRHAYSEARPGRRVQEMRQDRRRRDGLVPSARRPGDLRGPGAPRPGLRLALSADRGSGQFRQHRRRQRRRLPLHRSPPDRRRASPDGGRRRGFRRLARQLFRRHARADRHALGRAEPARQRRARHCGRHGDIDPAAQHRRALRRGAPFDRPSESGHGGADTICAGPRLPDRRGGDRRQDGDRRDLPDRPRRLSPARPLDEGGHRPRRLGRGRDRNPVRRAEVAPDRTDRRSAQPAQAAAARRRARRVDRGRAHRARAQEPRGRARRR